LLNHPATPVLLIVAIAIGLFASGRFRLDVVALLVLLSLTLCGALTPDEAFAGFGSPLIILVAGLMVVGEALDRTGVAHAIGRQIGHLGAKSRVRSMSLLMLSAAGLSTIMSSTAVVAIFIPIIFRLAKITGLSASRLLMPTSLAAMISGMITLIATPPNLIVSDALRSAGHAPLSFFGFAPVGLVVLSIAVVYILTIGDRLLCNLTATETAEPQISLEDMWRKFAPGRELRLVQVSSTSPLCGTTISESQIESRFGVRVLRLSQDVAPNADTELRDADGTDRLVPGCLLRIVGTRANLEQFISVNQLITLPYPEAMRARYLQERGAAMVMIHPESRLIGKTIQEFRLRWRLGVHVLSLRRDGHELNNYSQVPLRFADMLFVVGPWERIAHLSREHHDLVIMELPAEYAESRPAYRRAPRAIAVIMAMVVLSILGVAPISIIVLAAALAVVAWGCMTAAEAYRSISWSSIVLLAGMLPVATALENTGGTQAFVDLVLVRTGTASPWVLLSLLFWLSAGLSLFLSNTATAVILAPVAIGLAETLGVSPYPLGVTVLIGVSSAFASPVASPVVTLVVEPGKYSFADFFKVGAPLMLCAYIVNLIITPWLYPF